MFKHAVKERERLSEKAGREVPMVEMEKVAYVLAKESIKASQEMSGAHKTCESFQGTPD